MLPQEADRRGTRHAACGIWFGVGYGHRPQAASPSSPLEDETGTVNVIVWRDLSDRQRRELLGSRLLAVYGKVEREGQVVHLIAGHLVDLSPLLGALPTRSRDFH